MTPLESAGATARRRRWPAGLIGAIALAVAVEFGLARVGRTFGSLISADWRRSAPAVARATVIGAEIVCLGDSQIKSGIAPSALEARLDRPVYNLAVMGGPPAASYFIFKRALDAGVRPRAIILDAAETQLWAYKYLEYVSTWAELLNPIEALQLARDDRDLSFFNNFVLNYFLPSVRFRLEVRKSLSDALAAVPTKGALPFDPVVDRQIRMNRGGMVFSAIHDKNGPDPWPDGALPAGEASLCYRTAPGAGPFAHPTNLVYMGKLLDLAEARGIPVFFLVPPIHAGTLAQRERRGLDVPYFIWLRRIHDRYRNVTVVDGRYSGYEHGLFIDSFHLNAEGTTALSDALADLIAARLDGQPEGGRWVPLPRFTQPRVKLEVEELAESISFVSRMRARR